MELGNAIAWSLRLLFLALIIKYLVFSEERASKDFSMTTDKVHEITTQGALLNSTGHLIEAGWSRTPMKKVNKEFLADTLFGFKPFTWLKYKQFETAEWRNQDYHIMVELKDVGYTHMGALYVWDIIKEELLVDMVTYMPWESKPLSDHIAMKKNGLEISYDIIGSGSKRVWKVSSEKLDFKTEFEFEAPGNENNSISLISRLADSGRYWHNTDIDALIPTKGHFTKGNQESVDFVTDFGLQRHASAMFPYKFHGILLTANGQLPDGRKIYIHCNGGYTRSEEPKNTGVVLRDGKPIEAHTGTDAKVETDGAPYD